MRVDRAWLAMGALAVWTAACSGGSYETAVTATTRPTTTTQATPTTAVSTSTTVPNCGPPVETSFDSETQRVVQVGLICSHGTADLDLRALPRVVPAAGRPLTAALIELLNGITAAEAESGYESVFASATAGTLRSAAIDDGVAILDLTTSFANAPNFSTSNVSHRAMSQIEATVFQFPNVTGLEFKIDGERWCGWENTCEGTPYPLRTRSSHEEQRRRAQLAAVERARTQEGN